MRMCADGRMECRWNNCMQIMGQTLHLVAVVDVAMCLLLLAGMALLVSLCVCRDTVLFVICGEW